MFATPALAGDRAVQEGDVIEIHYTGKLKDDTIFDKSEGREPLKFTVGTKQIIAGMNKAVVGMKVGETKTVTMSPEEAYGPYNDKLIFEIETEKLPPQAKAGSQLMVPVDGWAGQRRHRQGHPWQEGYPGRQSCPRRQNPDL
jgi:peptidylprolyl isomerase